MKLILLSDSGRESLTINTHHWRVRLFALVTLASLILAGVLLSDIGRSSYADWQTRVAQQKLQDKLAAERLAFEHTREQVEHELAALTVKIASLQARIIRLDALGERVVQVAKLDKGEFDFSQPPAVGGPELESHSDAASHALSAEPVTEILESADSGAIYQLLEELEARVEDREHQLSVLDRQILAKELRSESYVTGRPVKWGWLSSAYGHRTDPFSGKKAWHNGVDFAGREGSDVVAVAAGVITESGKRYGYGNMVEINHGNGIVTRYAHNKTNLVAIGDIVEKGEAIARMGSTGRSTGPHVHFEVLRHGKSIDPERYIYRASL